MKGKETFMDNETYMKAGLDSRRLLLLFMGKLWLAALALILGAVFGAGLYLLNHLVLAPEREYQSVSKLYLNFDIAPQDMNNLTYNGYTWNDLMDTDPILDVTMQNLSEGMEREKVAEATKAEILSDIRLLTVTVTEETPELADEIMGATQAALIRLGETDELFHSIEIYSTQKAKQILWDNRTLSAAVCGALAALLVFITAGIFYYILEDSVYVQADAQKRFGIPVVGILTGGKGKSIPMLEEECASNFLYLFGDRNTVLVHPRGEEAAAEAVQALAAQSNGILAEKELKLKGEGLEHVSPRILKKLRSAEKVILAVPFGAGNGSRMKQLIDTLEKQDVSVAGVLITEADSRFLRRYYFGNMRI